MFAPALIFEYPWHLVIAYAIIAYLGYQDWKRQELDKLSLLLLACVAVGHLIVVMPSLTLTYPYIAVFSFFLILLIALFVLAIKFNIVIMTISDYAVLLFMLFILIDALPVFILQMIFSVLTFAIVKRYSTVTIEGKKFVPFVTVIASSIPVTLLFIFMASLISSL